MMFEMIVNESIQFNFPKKFNSSSKLIVKQLMAKNPKKRLGSGPNGIQDIKNHPFFCDIDWDLLESKQVPVPYKPTLESQTDTKYVDKEFLRQSKRDKRDF